MMRESKVTLSRIPEEVIGRVISRVRTVDSTEVEEVDSSLFWLESLCVVEIGIEAEVPGLEKDEWKER